MTDPPSSCTSNEMATIKTWQGQMGENKSHEQPFGRQRGGGREGRMDDGKATRKKVQRVAIISKFASSPSIIVAAPNDKTVRISTVFVSEIFK
jgi:hypothetical protein